MKNLKVKYTDNNSSEEITNNNINLEFAAKVIFSFIKEMQNTCNMLDDNLSIDAKECLQDKIIGFLSRDIKDFDQLFKKVVNNEKEDNNSNVFSNSPFSSDSVREKIRLLIKNNTPTKIKDIGRKNKLISATYKIVFSPSQSINNIKKYTKNFLSSSAASSTGTPANDSHKSQKKFISVLSVLTDEQIEILSDAIIKADIANFEKAISDAIEFNSIPSKKSIIVNHVFTTTWAPTLDALNEKGWTTAWLGNNDVKQSEGYAALTTEQIPATKKYPESFLGTLVFMAAMNNDSKVLLCGECYYAANWSGEDACVLFAILSSVTKAIKNSQDSKNRNLYLLMYDGLKPVAKSRQLNQEISKFYGEMMRSADKIIYNSNTEMFGEYIANAYNVTAPRLHFYRYSKSPTKPLPRLSFGKNGDEFHMACITVCLAEFYEPSRDSVPNFVRNIIEQGIHFHYYCLVNDTVVKDFHNSIKPEFRSFFHPHPINKDQQELVNELHQYHAAFNPSDHVTFSNGISQLNDREYQDGMSVFWQSTVGTSFVVYASSGLPFILPRGCVGSAEFLNETAIPLTLAEFKNMKNHLKQINLQKMCENVEGGSKAGWMDTHIDKLIKFLEEEI